jgi:hypothetical protein
VAFEELAGLGADAQVALAATRFCWPAGTTLGGFFSVVGRDAFLAFRYKPQALQIVAPAGDLLHNGVLVVPQLL